MIAFRARLMPLASGGQYVVLSDATAVAAGVGQHDRIRGTVEGVAYQSSVARYSGELHVGVPSAVVRAIGAAIGDIVELTVERDPEPPGERIPDDLAAALATRAEARAGLEAMSPAHRREHVKHVLEAVKPETRARRIEATLAALEAHARAVAAKAMVRPAAKQPTAVAKQPTAAKKPTAKKQKPAARKSRRR